MSLIITMIHLCAKFFFFGFSEIFRPQVKEGISG